MFKPIAVVAALALSFSVYAAQSWAAGPSQSAEALSKTSGTCKLMAEVGDSFGGFVVISGRPQFVGGAAARQHKLYIACMEANGFDTAGAPIDNPSSSL